MTDERQEYEAALAAYRAATQRLTEAKRHYDPKTAPEVIAKRRASVAARRARLRAERQAWLASPERALDRSPRAQVQTPGRAHALPRRQAWQ